MQKSQQPCRLKRSFRSSRAARWRGRLLLAGLTLTLAAEATAAPCEVPDQVSRVSGKGECLVVRTHARSDGAAAAILYVLLHGNHSNSRGPATSLYPVAQRLSERAPSDAVVVAMIRPGYKDADGNQSGGNAAGHADNWYGENVDIVADAIANLKKFHRARRVVLVGHSGGAATAGVILGRHPGLADAAVLVGCPCDMQAWRLLRSGPPWTSESPHRYVERIPAGTRVLVVVGGNDAVTLPALSSSYVGALRARGIAAELDMPQDADHRNVIDLPLVIDGALRLGRGD